MFVLDKLPFNMNNSLKLSNYQQLKLDQILYGLTYVINARMVNLFASKNTRYFTFMMQNIIK